MRIDCLDAHPDLPQRVMGTDQAPTVGEYATIEPGAQIQLLRVGERGIDEGAIVSFLMDTYQSVATGVIAAYLYDKIKNHSQTIRINGEDVSLTREAIQKKLDELEETEGNDGDTE